MANNRIVNIMPDKTPEAAIAQAGPFRCLFAVGGNDRKTGVFVNGLTSGQSVPVKLMINFKLDEFINDPSTIQSTDLMQIRTDGFDVAFTPDDNLKSFEVPGIYVMDVPSGYTVTVGLNK